MHAAIFSNQHQLLSPAHVEIDPTLPKLLHHLTETVVRQQLTSTATRALYPDAQCSTKNKTTDLSLNVLRISVKSEPPYISLAI
mmetsp:Transcript_27570/g.42757  ORF Transcript_27570/g.42757 Transcript_27570/m.42757 type:complete len:84 (+) Transcript_27570:357-608(+)